MPGSAGSTCGSLAIWCTPLLPFHADHHAHVCCATALQARNKQYNALSNKLLQKEREMQQAEGQLKVGGGATGALCRTQPHCIELRVDSWV